MRPPRPWKWSLDDIVRSLLLIRLGQLLGSDSSTARAVHDLVESLLSICR
jgi:hypothetical protein